MSFACGDNYCAGKCFDPLLYSETLTMRLGQHWNLFCIATTWWTLFFIAGLSSDYFQTAPLWTVLIFGELMPAIALGYFGWRRCSRAPQQAWRIAFWIAFYMTVPLFVYDYLYLANHQARGFAFLQTHWYLTAFYAIPWMLLPPVAWKATGSHTSRN